MKPWALITGASGKLGQTIAGELSSRGFGLILHGFKQRPSRLDPANEIVIADFSNRKELGALEALLESGRVSLLVNSASRFKRSPLSQTSYQELAETFLVNCLAPLSLIQALARGLGQNPEPCSGLVVNILDSKIQRQHSYYAPYTLSRKALAQAGGLASLEYQDLLRINSIAPTDLDSGEGAESLAEFRACLARVLDDPELKDVCLFLDGRILKFRAEIYLDTW